MFSLNPTRLLYLDFDGVFIVPEYLRKPNARCVAVLNQLIRETGAHVVVSSAHRHLSHCNLPSKAQRFLHLLGIDCVVEGLTGPGYCPGDTVPLHSKFDGQDLNSREAEILIDVDKRGVKQWCAIDDSVRNRYRMVRVMQPINIGFCEDEAVLVYNWLTMKEKQRNVERADRCKRTDCQDADGDATSKHRLEDTDN